MSLLPHLPRSRTRLTAAAGSALASGALVALAALPAVDARAATPAADALPAAAASATSSPTTWTGAWATSPQRMTGTSFTDRTLRMLVHPTLGGSAVRLRLSNRYGAAAVSLDAAAVSRAVAAGRADLVADTTRTVTFAGKSGLTLAAGEDAISDPVDLAVGFGQELAVDVHVASGGDAAALTGHDSANGTQFSAAGKQPGGAASGFTTTLNSTFWLSGVDVVAAPGVPGSIVALGDSITDGAYSTWNGTDRWTDVLAARLQEQPVERQYGVLNQGIGGAQLLTDRTDCCNAGTSVAGLTRAGRDAFGQSGVRYVIAALGINDLGYGVDADRMIAGLTALAAQAKTAGVAVIGATITPYGCDSGCLSATQEAARQKINSWIRSSPLFAGVADFDAALRDPAHPNQLLASFQADKLHPNVAGQRAMAQAIDLSILR